MVALENGFAYQHTSITPDIMTLAKSLCGGIAGGALLAKQEIAPSLRPGMHAATFGGNPIAARAGIATIEMIEKDNLLDRANQLSTQFENQLAPLVDSLPIVSDLRIKGLMIGLELCVDATPIVQQCLEQRLLVNCTQGNVLRLLPAMTLSDDQLKQGCGILTDILQKHQP